MKRFRVRSANKKVEELTTVPLFDHVPRRVLELIAANLDEVRVEPGRTLIHEGHRNDAFWIVMEGEADMTIGGRQHRVGPGQFFGATSMLDGKPALGTVVSRTALRAYVASAAQFHALEGNETIALRLFHYALERMREDLEAHASAAPPARKPRARRGP
ncbi:MAG TPA: cyclic nucleotide-binding domain-containing protein [Candidatus Dormibacteraeota bacterium]|jgi:CRP-like cAMP-binding protein